MEGAEVNYVPHEVHVLRPVFTPSEEMFKALRRLLGSETDANRVVIYGSKEVTLDASTTAPRHFERHLAIASRELNAETHPILFTRRGIIGGKVRDRSTRLENIRIGMPTSDQHYFNDLVSIIDDIEIEGERLYNIDPQPKKAQHYPYFEVHPDQLPEDKEERLKLLGTFATELMDHSHFLLPDKYTHRSEARWTKVTQLPDSRPSLPSDDEPDNDELSA